MRIKTMFIVGIAVLLTIILMQNTSEVMFTVLFASFFVSKLTMLLFVGVIAFILGILVGRPKRTGLSNDWDHDRHKPNRPELSDEDRDYIN